MRVSKNPPVGPDPNKKFRKSSTRTVQLGRVGRDGTWMQLGFAASIAFRDKTELFTGYFAPNSKEVRTANAQTFD
jgi:hypothetical protein